ncbi:MAG: FAD-binding oxidoreductase [Gemmatimonadaceae bacterium]
MTLADVREAVRDAAATRAPLRIAGRRTWLQAGRPVRATRTLSLSDHSGVVQYEPGDFTLTARAGTTLDELAHATLPHRQFLALDPFGDAGGTLGATVATGANGPMAQAFGGPRDNVIGLEVVTGDGAVVRCGGRVVKNVAGFDLTRLFTGAWGTLGAITEASVRLRALPAVDESFAMAVDDRPATLSPLVAALRSASIAPFAIEVLSQQTAAALFLGTASVVLVRLGGNRASVRAQRGVLERLRPLREVDGGVWRTLSALEPADAIVARLSSLSTRIATVWDQARDAVASERSAMVIASLGRGVVRCVLPATAEEAARKLARCEASVTFERLPAALWSELAPSPTRDRLSRGVKERFDPAHVLNPGILGEEDAR